MITIAEKKECCGCSACYNICPVNAIIMKADEEGFLYPQINIEDCVNCGKCEKVCPLKKSSAIVNSFVACGAVIRSKDSTVLMDSTSGGFFTPVAEHILECGGEVFAATYDESFCVVHDCCKNQSDIPRFRGSKYVQSDLSDIFRRIKRQLDRGQTIGFFGTTCQVYGLKSFIGRTYENLYTVDLVCHGTSSPKLWKKYLSYQEKKYGSSIKNVNFRSKKYGYHVASMTIDFESGYQYCASARTDIMLRSFFSEISSRPSCYDCHFKVLERVSDITIFDAWHANVLLTNLKDDDKGFTNVIVHNHKGLALLMSLQDKIDIHWVNIDDAIALDGLMIMNSAKPHRNRDLFYFDIDSEDIMDHINKFVPITLMDIAIDRFKNVFYKFGILNSIKKIKNKI